MKQFAVVGSVALLLSFSGTAVARVSDGPPNLPVNAGAVDAVAPASQDLRSADSRTPAAVIAPASQDLRSADSRTTANVVAPASQDLRSADSRIPAERAAAPAITTVDLSVPDDGGLSTWLIMLIGVGGGLALAAIVLSTRHVLQGRQPAA